MLPCLCPGAPAAVPTACADTRRLPVRPGTSTARAGGPRCLTTNMRARQAAVASDGLTVGSDGKQGPAAASGYPALTPCTAPRRPAGVLGFGRARLAECALHSGAQPWRNARSFAVPAGQECRAASCCRYSHNPAAKALRGLSASRHAGHTGAVTSLHPLHRRAVSLDRCHAVPAGEEAR